MYPTGTSRSQLGTKSPDFVLNRNPKPPAKPTLEAGLIISRGNLRIMLMLRIIRILRAEPGGVR